MISLMHRRWFRRLLWTLVTLITLWVLLAAVLSWTGQRRWQRLQDELQAKGETLDFLSLLPPAIPDGQNLAAIEALNGIRRPSGHSPEAKAAEAKRQALQSACKLVGAPLRKAMEGDVFHHARAPELSQIIQALQEQKDPLVPPNADAQVLRLALEKKVPELKQLAESMRSRPKVEFLPRWDAITLPEFIFALPVPHYQTVQDLARMVRLHGLACLESGDTVAAAADVEVILLLCRGALKEPLLISHIVGLAMHHQAIELVWLVLRKRTADEATLQRLQTALEAVEIPKSLLQAMRGEMAAGADAAALLEADARQRALLIEVTQAPPSKMEGLLMALIPNGLFTHMKASIVRVEHDLLVRPILESGLKNALHKPDQAEAWSRSISLWKRPDYLLARLGLPAAGVVRTHSAFAENSRRQAMLACALEHHFIQHGNYPAEMPGEAFDGTAMKYKLTPDGRYQLWHNGPDGKDDGGSLRMEKPGATTGSVRTRTYLGDWVWRYAP